MPGSDSVGNGCQGGGGGFGVALWDLSCFALVLNSLFIDGEVSTNGISPGQAGASPEPCRKNEADAVCRMRFEGVHRHAVKSP